MQHSTLAVFTLTGTLIGACGSIGDGDNSVAEGPLSVSTPGSSTTGAPPAVLPQTPGSDSPPTAGGAEPSDQTEVDMDTDPALQTPGGGEPEATPAEMDSNPSTPAEGPTDTDTDVPNGTGASPDGEPGDVFMPGVGQETETPPAQPAVECTDIPPDDRETCATWAEWGECGSEWLADFCNASCNRCDGGMSVPPAQGGGGESENGSDTGAPQDNGEGSTQLGDDNPYPPIDGGQQGNSTRYWDCCKQSCGWSANASNPVSSCDYQGNNIGVNDQDRNVCDGGNATTCHGMAPWAHSTALSFGYAAANGAGCGTCWQLQFTGSSGSAPGDSGSAAISGKTMVVMATNIGDLNGSLHFDLLIPGGGLGLNNGCSSSLGIPEGELGANRGGFLTECASAGEHNAKKECVRNKCSSVFGGRGLSDLEAGCLWFVDWFEVADNPDFLVQQVDCPAELRGFN